MSTFRQKNVPSMLPTLTLDILDIEAVTFFIFFFSRLPLRALLACSCYVPAVTEIYRGDHLSVAPTQNPIYLILLEPCANIFLEIAINLCKIANNIPSFMQVATGSLRCIAKRRHTGLSNASQPSVQVHMLRWAHPAFLPPLHLHSVLTAISCFFQLAAIF